MHDADRRLAEARRAAIREGLDELDRGEGIAFEDIDAWIESWDASEELPPPAARK